MCAAPGIAIIGGGLGGLTLARILQTHGVHSAVYEREASRHCRSQGGTLDMHPQSGQRALSSAGLSTELQSIVRPGGEDTRIVDKSGAVLWDEIPPDGTMNRPEVDRAALRGILLDSLAPGVLQWGRALTHLQPANGGGYTLHFSDGSTEHAALVVGADGASSRVRPFLSDATQQYCGVGSVEIGLPDADIRHPALAKLVGRGSMFALGDNKGLIAQRNGDGRIRVYVVVRAPEEWLSAIPCADQPAVSRAMLAAEFSDWAPQLVDLIMLSDDQLVPRRITGLPVGHRWEPRPGITLLGDAAHLMPPFAGEGANLAMLDAVELADAIVQGNDLKEYETVMFARSQAAAEESMQGLNLCISHGCSAQRFANFMAQMVDGPPHEQTL